jgi:hypothetical protein
MKMSNDKIQMTNQIQKTKFQNGLFGIGIFSLGIHLAFGF